MSNYLRLARDRATAADLYATVVKRFLDDELQHWRKALLTRPTTSKLLEYAREKCSQRWVCNQPFLIPAFVTVEFRPWPRKTHATYLLNPQLLLDA